MTEILKLWGISAVSVTPFKSVEDGEEYEVWLVSDGEKEYVLKKAKGDEIAICSAFFSEQTDGAPQFLGAVEFNGETYFLMEHFAGKDLCKCTRDELIKVLDALISLQKKYWNSDEIFYERALEGRINRGKYLFDRELEAVYSQYLDEFKALPRTLCHDDLLPFNVLISESGAKLIDWEVAGVLPYPTSLARLIAHTKNDPDYIFYMSDEDRLFAIEYYYKNFVAEHGISYEEYRRSLDLFVFYEYCEWIMVGNKYNNAKGELFEEYSRKAKESLKFSMRAKAYDGNPEAQLKLAQYCDIENDSEQSVFWYRQAALGGNGKALDYCQVQGIDLHPPKPPRKMLQCRTFPAGNLNKYMFTAVCSNFNGKWLLSMHKERDTWETQGGHIEDGETPLECARRELFEESGIIDADIYPVCDYWGFDSQGCANGMVFLAVVHSLGELPESEMKEIGIFDSLPQNLTYPQVTPRFFAEAEKLFHKL